PAGAAPAADGNVSSDQQSTDSRTSSRADHTASSRRGDPTVEPTTRHRKCSMTKIWCRRPA
uniref:Copper-containing nitrite reductase n=1 Tax=Macrostomum lignano TaxID=282301 RepID=A0A1I8HEJ6_9PLAT